MKQFTMNLTEEEYERFRTAAENSQVSLEAWLKYQAEKNNPSNITLQAEVAQLPDDVLLSAAQALMSESEMDRLEELRRLRQPSLLEVLERDYLQNKYWVGQYRKTEAMIEVQKRGLM